jgi:hypothetical protein
MKPERLAVVIVAVALAVVLAAGCSQQKEPESRQEVVIATFPVMDATALADTADVVFDPDVSSDGNGSFRVTTDEPKTVTIYQLGDLDLESVELDYQARVKCEDVDGQVFIEMICVFPEKGEFFSRALQSEIMGTTDWMTQTTPFFLKEGQNPSNIMLNLVVNGSGTAWIDDIHVTGSPYVGQ